MLFTKPYFLYREANLKPKKLGYGKKKKSGEYNVRYQDQFNSLEEDDEEKPMISSNQDEEEEKVEIELSKSGVRNRKKKISVSDNDSDDFGPSPSQEGNESMMILE